MRRSQVQQFVIIFISFTLIVVAFAWICPMAMRSMDTMASPVMTGQTTSSCPSQTTHDSCALAFAKQIAHIQQATLTIPQLEQFFSILFAIAAILLALYLNYITKLLLSLYHRYIEDNPDIKQFNFLFTAFSKGLIHPKLYY